MERQRFSEEWRRLPSFQAPRRAGPSAPAGATKLPVITTSTFPESHLQIHFPALDYLPFNVPIRGDLSGPTVLRAQILLDRVRYSPGIIDGRSGKSSSIAVFWFQKEHGPEATGDVDEATMNALLTAGGPATFARTHTLSRRRSAIRRRMAA